MSFKQKKTFLGIQLVEDGIISREQLEDALEQQKTRAARGAREFLGQTLVSLGYCSEVDIAKVIAKRTGAVFASLKLRPVNMAAANLISPDVANRYRVLPLDFENNRLVVAMMNPSDIIAIDDLRLLTGYDIQPAVMPDSEIRAAIAQFVNTGTNVEEEVEQQSEAADMDESDEKPAVQLANQIFNQAVKAGASDIHIEPQETRMRVRFRIDGVLHEVMNQPSKIHPSLVTRIKVMSSMDIAERRIPQDGRITMRIEGRTIDVRAATLPSTYGEKMTMRLIDRGSRLITLSELGFPESQLKRYHAVSKLPYGFILITGPTGSGKSTTLYATLSRLNSVDKNIITLEDPIERRMEGINQIQVNTKAGMTFASGLRSILRNDPDIIMVGEIRDHETARIAVESALTGHLVLSTLHTNDSAGAVTRLGDMGVEPYLTASSLVGVVAQRLARLLCPYCKKPYEITREELLETLPDFPVAADERILKLYHSKGCVQCNNTGYKGRIAIFEFLTMSESIRKLILKRSSTSDIRNAALAEGMISMRQDGFLKIKQGATSIEELMRVIA